MTMQVNKQTIQIAAICLNLSLLTACGGGGSDSSSSTPPPSAPAPTSAPAPDYTPDATALDSSANKSTDLYVETDFTFDTYKVVTLDISATDPNGNALGNTLMFISVIDNEITELDDERLQNKELLSVAKTDENGSMYRQVEIASTVTKLLIELNTLGIENEVIVTINADNYVSYQFK